MKKWLTRLGILFGGLLGLVFAIPFFIQVDRYRPQIEQAVNQKIRGQLQLGRLSISLWGHLWVEVAGVQLQDSSKAEILSVKHAYLELPFSSVFSGSPQISFKMDAPSVHLARDSQGQLNVMGLMGTSESKGGSSARTDATLTQKQPDAKLEETPKPAGALPAILVNSRLGFELKSALLTYEDRKSGLKTEIKDFNLKLEDLSMSHPVHLEAWTDLNTQVGKTLTLQGPIRLEGKAQPIFQGQSFQSLSLNASLNASEVEVQVPGAFQKKKGVEAKSQILLKVLPDQVQIEQFKTVFLNAELRLQGNVSDFNSNQGPRLNLGLATNDVQFRPWVAVIPALAQFELGGAAKVTAQLKGTPTQPAYDVSISVKDLSAKAPMLKTQPRWNAQVHVKTDQVDSIHVTFSAPGNQAELRGSVTSFKKPSVNFQLTSDQMDLDQLVDFPSKSAQKAEGQTQASSKSESGERESGKKSAGISGEVNYDAQVAELRKNPALGDWTGRFGVKIGKLKANEIQLSQLNCQLSFNHWITSLDSCGLKVFQGEIQSKLMMNLGVATPTYQGTLDVKGLDFAEAGSHSSQMFKNTLKGRGNFKMDLQGASFNPETAKSMLKAKGTLKVQPAAFTTLDIMKLVKDSIDQALLKVADKVPGLKGKGIGSLPSHSAEYDEMSGDFSIQNAVFSTPNFVAKAKAGRGVDLKGKTDVGIKNYSLDAFWEVVDTYNLTHLKDISVEQNGIKVENIFADGNGPVHFPFHVGCTLTSPCYTSLEIPEALGKVALGNLGKAVSNRAKSELMKKASELLNQAPHGIPAGLKDRLKGLFH